MIIISIDLIVIDRYSGCFFYIFLLILLVTILI